MMFLWIPFVFMIAFAIWRMAWHGSVGTGCCGMAHSMPDQGAWTQSPGTSDPVDIVRRRLARGEITPEEYEAIRRTLG